MKVEVLYDQYSSKINVAKLIFSEELTPEQVIELSASEDNITIKLVEESMEIENVMTKEDFRVFLNLLKDLASQI